MTKEQLDLFRQWFNSIEDTNAGYLNAADYTLYIEIMKELGLRISHKTTEKAQRYLKETE